MVQAANYILKSPCLWNKVRIAGLMPLLISLTLLHRRSRPSSKARQSSTSRRRTTTALSRTSRRRTSTSDSHLRTALFATAVACTPCHGRTDTPLTACSTYESFFFRFLDSNLSIIQPNDPRWDLTGDSRKSGTPMPWNRRMLVLHGYIQLAIAHESPAVFDAKKTALYDTIVKRNVMDFLMALNEKKSVVNGKMT